MSTIKRSEEIEISEREYERKFLNQELSYLAGFLQLSEDSKEFSALKMSLREAYRNGFQRGDSYTRELMKKKE